MAKKRECSGNNVSTRSLLPFATRMRPTAWRRYGVLKRRGLAYRRNTQRRYRTKRYGFRRKYRTRFNKSKLSLPYWSNRPTNPFIPLVDDNLAISTGTLYYKPIAETITVSVAFGSAACAYVDLLAIYGKLQVANTNEHPVVLNVAVVDNKWGNASTHLPTQFFKSPTDVLRSGVDFSNALFTGNEYKRNTFTLNRDHWNIFFHKRYILQGANGSGSGFDSGRTGTIAFGLTSRFIRFKVPIKRRYWKNPIVAANCADCFLFYWAEPMYGFSPGSPVCTISQQTKAYFRNTA